MTWQLLRSVILAGIVSLLCAAVSFGILAHVLFRVSTLPIGAAWGRELASFLISLLFGLLMFPIVLRKILPPSSDQ